jgi:hypothetical protein
MKDTPAKTTTNPPQDEEQKAENLAAKSESDGDIFTEN